MDLEVLSAENTDISGDLQVLNMQHGKNVRACGGHQGGQWMWGYGTLVGKGSGEVDG